MHHYTGDNREVLRIPKDADASGFHVLSLIEVPDSGSLPNVTTAPKITGYSEYRGDPYNFETNRLNLQANQFWVNYQTGQLLFHPANAEEEVWIDYWGRGSLIEADDINDLNNRIVRLENLNATADITEFYIFAQPQILALNAEFPEEYIRIYFKWNFAAPQYVQDVVLEDITNENILFETHKPTTFYELDQYTLPLEYIHLVTERVSYNYPFTLTYRLTATNVMGDIFTKEFSVKWVNKMWTGSVASIDQISLSQITNTPPIIKEDPFGIYEIPRVNMNEYRFILMPQDRYMQISTIKDLSTGLGLALKQYPSLFNIDSTLYVLLTTAYPLNSDVTWVVA